MSEQEAFEGLARVDLEERRRRFRQTTPAERLETCIELGELGRELRRGLEGREEG